MRATSLQLRVWDQGPGISGSGTKGPGFRVIVGVAASQLATAEWIGPTVVEETSIEPRVTEASSMREIAPDRVCP